jgi:DNA repair ATPase RecN
MVTTPSTVQPASGGTPNTVQASSRGDTPAELSSQQTSVLAAEERLSAATRALADHEASVRALEARRLGLEAEVDAAARALEHARAVAVAGMDASIMQRLHAAALSMGEAGVRLPKSGVR